MARLENSRLLLRIKQVENTAPLLALQQGLDAVLCPQPVQKPLVDRDEAGRQDPSPGGFIFCAFLQHHKHVQIS